MSKPDKISNAVGRRGLMLVLSSPSGAGKTSIARRLLDEDDNLTLSVSATTRPPRANEVDGRDYHFVDQERFDRMVAQDEFLEYATVFSNSYGTPKADVMSALERGEDVLFDIDWQGTQQVAECRPRRSCLGFHSAAIAYRSARAPCLTRAGQRRSGGRPHGKGVRRDQAIIVNMTISWSMMILNGPLGRFVPFLLLKAAPRPAERPDSLCKGSAVRGGISPFPQ